MSSQDALQKGQRVNLVQLPSGFPSGLSATIRSVHEDQLTALFEPSMEESAAKRLQGREIMLEWSVGQAAVLVQHAHAHGFEATVVNETQRQFVRVPIRLPMRYQEVPEAHLETVRQEIMTLASRPEDLDIQIEQFWHSEDLGERMNAQFNQMARFMRQIDEKLDYLIGLAEGEEPQGTPMKSATLIDLSGAGVAFETRESIAPETVLQVTLELSRFPAFEMKALGTVTRNVKSLIAETWEIGLRFEHINEDDRERIFRFISRVERKMLRERREAMEL